MAYGAGASGLHNIGRHGTTIPEVALSVGAAWKEIPALGLLRIGDDFQGMRRTRQERTEKAEIVLFTI